MSSLLPSPKPLPDQPLTETEPIRCSAGRSDAANQPTPAPALPLAELLAQLAALPPEHRAALAALLAPPTSPAASPLKPSPLSDRCPLDDKTIRTGE